MTDAAPLAGLAPDTPQAHAGLKAARELIRRGECAVALDVLSGPECRDTPLAQLLRADLLLAGNRPEPALALVAAVHQAHGDTGQGLLCAGHAALAQGERANAAAAFARAAAVAPDRIAARVNAAAFFPPSPVAATAPAVAVTSLPPGADARCRAAVASWGAAGFSAIVSVNTPAEITALAKRFPQVAFVPGATTALAAFGRPYAGLPQLLAAGAATGAAVVAVINADLVLAAGPDFAGRLASAATGGAVIACRVDVAAHRSASAASSYYDVGFDLCAVEARLADRLELDGFYLGLPWWDYALPLAVVRAGGLLRFCPAPLSLHAVHGAVWSHRAFVTLGHGFVRRFWPQLACELLDDRVVDAGIETVLAGLGGRTATVLRRAPDAGLWDRTGFCPHDPGFAAALLPLTVVTRTD